jgi:hypothetical protein
VTGWLPQIADDEAVPAGGWTIVADPETGDEAAVAVDAAMAAAMRRELLLLRKQQDTLFGRFGASLQRLQLPHADFTVGAWLEAGWNFRP